MKETQGKLPVMEQFYTLQGEGFYTGQAAYFIRLAGCDVGCHWCDVKESWDINDNQWVEIDSLIENIKESGSQIAVITGGEPLMHNLDELTKAIQSIGVRTHVETAGVHPLTGSWDWICLSPKKFKPTRPEYFEQAHELKVVIFNFSDFDWAKDLAENCINKTRFYVQPEWSKEPEISMSLVNFVKNNPEWTLSLQTHKYLEIP